MRWTQKNGNLYGLVTFIVFSKESSEFDLYEYKS